MIVFWGLWTASECQPLFWLLFVFSVAHRCCVLFTCLLSVLIGCLLESKEGIQPNFLFPFDMLSITLIRLKGSYYAQWAQVIEDFLLIVRSLLI